MKLKASVIAMKLLYLSQHQVDEREIPSLKPQQILHFIEGIGLGPPQEVF
jgi:hypothetical protein